MPAIVVRTCIGCRAAVDQQELVRVALDHGTDTPSVRFDPVRRRPGRGAWLHPDPDCVSRALARRGFPRAFRARVDTTAIEEAVQDGAESLSAALAARTPADRPTHEGGSEI